VLVRKFHVDVNGDQGNLTQWWMLRGSPPNLHLFTEHEDPVEDLTGNRPRTASVYARENQDTVYVINVRFSGVKANQKGNAT